MVAQLGKDLILDIEDDLLAGTYNAVGGFRSNSFTINGESVEITNKGSNGFREFLDGAGIRSLSASGSGVFEDDVTFAGVNDKVLAGTIANWRITVPGLGTYTGKFHIGSLEMAGEHNGEVTYSISLESAGAITFAAV